jgi:hypothetical protein
VFRPAEKVVSEPSQADQEGEGEGGEKGDPLAVVAPNGLLLIGMEGKARRILSSHGI